MKHKSNDVLVNILLIIALVFFVFSAFFALSSKKDNDVFIFGYKPFLVSTGSMVPKYPIHTLVVIKKGGLEAVKVGGTIAFKSPAVQGGTVFHRVVGKTENGLVTKGDNNQVADQFIVTADNYIGSEAFHTTLTVYLANFFSSRHQIVIASSAILAFGLALLDFKRRRRARKSIQIED